MDTIIFADLPLRETQVEICNSNTFVSLSHNEKKYKNERLTTI